MYHEVSNIALNFGKSCGTYRASPVAQMVESLPAMQKTWVWSLGSEELLEKEMATHSSFLAWKIPWRQEPGGLHPMGTQSRAQRATHTHVVFITVILTVSLL